MYLSRLRLNGSRKASQWVSNPYRVHQRLKMACEADPRLLFRIDEQNGRVIILVQTHRQPDWQKAFAGLDVLSGPPEYKEFELALQAGRCYRFRLYANPAVKKTIESDEGKHKTRLGLLKEADQIEWLRRKLENGGAKLIDVVISNQALIRSHKGSEKEVGQQTHLGVLFEGVLLVNIPERLNEVVKAGIGPAKGYGFGLLSLAPA